MRQVFVLCMTWDTLFIVIGTRSSAGNVSLLLAYSVITSEQLLRQNTVQQITPDSAIFIGSFGEYSPFFCTGLKEEKNYWAILMSDKLSLLRQWILSYSFQVLFYWGLKKGCKCNQDQQFNNTTEMQLYYSAISPLSHFSNIWTFLVQWSILWICLVLRNNYCNYNGKALCSCSWNCCV